MTDDTEMIRWQDYAQAHRATANSHFLTYAAAVLAFQTVKILETPEPKQPLVLFISAIASALSFGAGTAFVLVRIKQARSLARAARQRREGDANAGATEYHAALDGEHVDTLLLCQVVLFTISVGVLLLWIALSAGRQLF